MITKTLEVKCGAILLKTNGLRAFIRSGIQALNFDDLEGFFPIMAQDLYNGFDAHCNWGASPFYSLACEQRRSLLTCPNTKWIPQGIYLRTRR